MPSKLKAGIQSYQLMNFQALNREGLLRDIIGYAIRGGNPTGRVTLIRHNIYVATGKPKGRMVHEIMVTAMKTGDTVTLLRWCARWTSLFRPRVLRKSSWIYNKSATYRARMVTQVICSTEHACRLRAFFSDIGHLREVKFLSRTGFDCAAHHCEASCAAAACFGQQRRVLRWMRREGERSREVLKQMRGFMRDAWQRIGVAMMWESVHHAIINGDTAMLRELHDHWGLTADEITNYCGIRDVSSHDVAALLTRWGVPYLVPSPYFSRGTTVGALIGGTVGLLAWWLSFR